MLVITGILLPTGDSFCDMFTIWKFFMEGHPWFAFTMTIPLLLSVMFLVPHWLKSEASLEERIFSFPFLISQIWPQIKVIELIILGRSGNPTWQAKEKSIQREVSSVGKWNDKPTEDMSTDSILKKTFLLYSEPFTEAIPQFFILLSILILHYELLIRVDVWTAIVYCNSGIFYHISFIWHYQIPKSWTMQTSVQWLFFNGIHCIVSQCLFNNCEQGLDVSHFTECCWRIYCQW